MNPKNFENMLDGIYDIYKSKWPPDPYQGDSLAYCEADVEAMKSCYEAIVDSAESIENTDSIKYIIPDDPYIFLVYGDDKVIKMLKSDYDLDKDTIHSMCFTSVCNNYGIAILNMEEITC